MTGRLRKAHATYGGQGEIVVLCPATMIMPSLPKDRQKFLALQRVVMVMQVISDKPHLIFGMYVYENPALLSRQSNTTGRVYVGYLDGTNTYQRTSQRNIYYDVINAYFEYVSAIGYHSAHIWACPPSDDDYNFYIFPNSGGRVHTADKLCEWYVKMCKHYHWPCRPALDEARASLRLFPGDVKQKGVVDARSAQLLEIDLTLHAEFGMYHELYQCIEADVSQRHVLMEQTLDTGFGSLEAARESTAILLQHWQPALNFRYVRPQLLDDDQGDIYLEHRRLASAAHRWVIKTTLEQPILFQKE